MTQPNEQVTLLTEAQAAELLKVRNKTIGDWSRSGKLPRVKLSARCIRYRASDIQALIDAATSEETEAQKK